MSAVGGAGRSLAIIALSGENPPDLPRQFGFGTVSAHLLHGGSALLPLAAHQAAVALALDVGADWMIVLSAGENLAGDALELVSPGLDLFDAIFGAAHVRGSNDKVSRLTRLAFDTSDRLPHALLNWWMPHAHLVRTKIVERVLSRVSAGDRSNWQIDYLFELWASARCMKSAQPLLELDFEPQGLGDQEKTYVLRRLAREPVFLPVVHGDSTYELPYTGRNAGIEKEQSRGLFFEAMELEELRKAIKPGARIVDVGANTGNHTIFFAGPMKAALVTPFEPFPDAASALRAAVLRNGLSNVDLSQLGLGVSDCAGRAKLVFSVQGGLGATSLVSDVHGEIGVAPLNSMISGPVDFLKIDVEGMEMLVLAGAERLVTQWRPLIFIEIANANTTSFVEWLAAMKYRILRIFTDKGHANYLIAPEGHS